MKFIKWLFWRINYGIIGYPVNLEDLLIAYKRTVWPYKKFKPCITHNSQMKEWTVYLENERYYSHTGFTINNVEIMFSVNEESKIVGFDIHDEELERISKEHKEWLTAYNSLRDKYEKNKGTTPP